jgi:hypothetical protein
MSAVTQMMMIALMGAAAGSLFSIAMTLATKCLP